MLKAEDITTEQEASDIEANLIEQSMHHIQSILVQHKTPNDASSVSNSTSDEKQRSNPTRRLRVFQEITANQMQLQTMFVSTQEKKSDGQSDVMHNLN